MLQRIEHMAEISVARGCAFASIAIFMSMIAYYGDAVASARIGGVLSLITCLVLLARALRAPFKPYKRTEVWIMMRAEERPPAGIAQQIIGEALRQAYLRFAMHAAFAALGLLAVSLVLRALR